MNIKEKYINDSIAESFENIECVKEEAYQQIKEVHKNTDFVQIYRQHMSEIRWLARTNAVAMEIFMFILEHMDTKNALACSYSILEDYTGKSKATVTRSIKVLKENGIVCVLKMGNCNVYVVNQEVAWTSEHEDKKYCKFNGTILVSHKENKDYAYKKSYDMIKKMYNPNLKKEGEF